MKHFFVLCSAVLLVLLPNFAHAETHALLIALGDYQDKGFTKLPALTNGANGLAKVLIKNGVPIANVELLTHESKVKPTRPAIQAALKRLGERVKKDDVVWVLYYGHGNQRQGVNYLSCYDSKPVGANAPSTGLSVREFLAPLSKLPASLLMLGFEACRAEMENENADATITQGVRQVDFNIAVPEGKQGPRRVAALLSSSESRNSYVLPNGSLGVFGSALIRGLEGGAADAQGIIRVRNLAAYLTKAVPGLAYREYGAPQMPEYMAFGDYVKDSVLSKGHEPQRGGESAVPLKMGDSPDEKWAAEFQQGYELREAKKPEEALTHFKAAADLKPEDNRAQSLVGVQFYELNRFAEAEPYFLRASKTKTPSPADFLYIGLIREQQGKLDEAETFHRKSYDLGKEWRYSSSLYGYGRFLFYYRHDYKKSEKILREAVKLDPQDPIYKMTLASALIYQEVKNTTEVEKLLTEVLKATPRYAEAHYTQGPMYARLKEDQDKAKKAYLKCLELDSGHTGALEGLSEIAYDVDDYEESERLLRKLIAVQPKDGRPQMLLAYTLYMQNDLDAARAAAKKAIELGAYDKDTEIFSLLNVKPDEKAAPQPDKNP